MGGLWEGRSGVIALFPMKCWQEKYTSLRVIAHPHPSVLGDSSTGPAAPGNVPTSLSGVPRFRGAPCNVAQEEGFILSQHYAETVCGPILLLSPGQTCAFCLFFFFFNCSRALQLKESLGIHSPLLIPKHDQTLSNLRVIFSFSSYKTVSLKYKDNKRKFQREKYFSWNPVTLS